MLKMDLSVKMFGGRQIVKQQVNLEVESAGLKNRM